MSAGTSTVSRCVALPARRSLTASEASRKMLALWPRTGNDFGRRHERTAARKRCAVSLNWELETYLRLRPDWVREGKVGKWVVIHQDEVAGFFDSFDDALRAGYDRYGLNEPFMARQVAEVELPLISSRRA